MIKKMFFLFLFLTYFFAPCVVAKQYIIMIDSASHIPGKEESSKLYKSFAWEESALCGEKLKEKLETTIEDVKVIFSHLPGQEITPLQCASFANWAAVDLFLRIDMCKDNGAKPCINVFHLVMDPILDFLPHQRSSAQFIPLFDVHCQSIETSKSIAQRLVNTLKQSEYSKTATIHGPFGIPFKPLIGITAPAISLEFGLGHDDQWKDLVDALVQGFKEVIDVR